MKAAVLSLNLLDQLGPLFAGYDKEKWYSFYAENLSYPSFISFKPEFKLLVESNTTVQKSSLVACVGAEQKSNELIEIILGVVGTLIIVFCIIKTCLLNKKTTVSFF